MRGECQRHLVIADVNVRLMIDFQGLFGDAAHKIYARHESLKLECAANGLRVLRPVRNGFQLKIDLLDVQGWHNNYKLIRVSPGAALFAAAGKFVDRGPGACFGGFHADTFFLIAVLDVRRLTLLFVGVTGFIALGHDSPLFGFDRCAVRRYRQRHIDAECGAQINFMILFLHDDRAKGLA